MVQLTRTGSWACPVVPPTSRSRARIAGSRSDTTPMRAVAIPSGSWRSRRRICSCPIPIRRRDWDSRHAPGPVRATERPVTPRPPPRPGAPNTGSPPRRPEDYAGKPPRPAEPRAATADPMSGRDPGTRSATWSARGVPWWEDFRADGSNRTGSAPTGGGPAPSGRAPGGPPTGGPAPGGRPAGGPGTTSSGTTAGRAANQPPLTGTGFSRRPNLASQPPNSGLPPSGGPPASQGPGAGDIYARSSGAAWSSAARRHFRKDDVDLPRGGAFRYRGTQVVTGGEARKDAEAEARRASMPPQGPRPPAAPPARVPSQPADAAGSAGLMSRLRKLLGGS